MAAIKKMRLKQLRRVIQVCTCLCLLGMALSIEWSYSHSQALVVVNYLADKGISPDLLAGAFLLGFVVMLLRPDLYFVATIPILLYIVATVLWALQSQVYQAAVMYSYAYCLFCLLMYVFVLWEEMQNG